MDLQTYDLYAQSERAANLFWFALLMTFAGVMTPLSVVMVLTTTVIR